MGTRAVLSVRFRLWCACRSTDLQTIVLVASKYFIRFCQFRRIHRNFRKLTGELGKKLGSHINDITSVLADFCDRIHVLRPTFRNRNTSRALWDGKGLLERLTSTRNSPPCAEGSKHSQETPLRFVLGPRNSPFTFTFDSLVCTYYSHSIYTYIPIEQGLLIFFVQWTPLESLARLTDSSEECI